MHVYVFVYVSTTRPSFKTEYFVYTTFINKNFDRSALDAMKKFKELYLYKRGENKGKKKKSADV